MLFLNLSILNSIHLKSWSCNVIVLKLDRNHDLEAVKSLIYLVLSLEKSQVPNSDGISRHCRVAAGLTIQLVIQDIKVAYMLSFSGETC